MNHILAQNFTYPGLEQLHDIEGLDSVNWWPPAIGWWLIVLTAVLVGGSIAWYILVKLAFRRSWKNDTIQKLTFLENNLLNATARDTILALSEYLRRIALRRFSRKECAGLVGEAWLQWLSANDPKQFEWEKKGKMIIDIPYAPTDVSIPPEEIKSLIQAVRNWVR